MSYTQYASGRSKLPFSNLNITTNNTGSLGVTGTYYLSIQGENRVGLNLNSDLVPVSVTPTTKIIITLPTILAAEDWQNIIISTSLTNDVETLTQIISVNKEDFTTPLELSSNRIFKLTNTERTVATINDLPSSPEQGLIRYITSLNYYYVYDKYSEETVNNTTILSATLGRWIRIGTINTYQENTNDPGGCDQDIRTPNLNPKIPDYAVDGSKGESVTYWIRNDFTDPIPSGTRVSGIIRLYEEDKSQLFDSLIILEAKGYVNLSTGVLNTSTATGEINYSPYITELVLEEDLPSGSAIAIEVSPKFRPEHLYNNVPYLANLQILLTFAPNSGVYAPGSKLLGNFIYNEYDKFRIVPQFGLSAKKLKGSGVINSYELFSVGEETISNILPNTNNQYIYLTSNASTVCTTANTLNGSVKRAKISTLDGISNPISYGNINLDNTSKLNIELNYITSIRSNYPDIISNSNKGTFNASYLVVIIKNNLNQYFKYEYFIPLNETSSDLTLNYSDFSSLSSLPSNSNNFGLYGIEDIVINNISESSNFPNSSYEVFLALRYLNTVTSIDHSVSELYEAELNISNIFSNSSSWRKAVSTKSELRNLERNTITNHQACYVFENNYIYFFDSSNTLIDNNDSIIRLDSNPGSWIKYTINTNKWFNGNTNPSSSLGSIGDFYLNTTNGDYFNKTDNVTWTFISSFKTNWLTDSGVPSNSLGNIGDFYIDLNNANLYKKTTITNWTLLRKLKTDWINNTSSPLEEEGNVGDYFINTSTSEYYIKTNNTTWDLLGSFSPSFVSGVVNTLNPGEQASASISNTGNPNEFAINLNIPRGNSGNNGTNGTAATITIGTVTTLSPGSSATVTNIGSSSAAVLNFGIPQGLQGSVSGSNGFTVTERTSPIPTSSLETGIFVSSSDKKLKYREENNGTVNTLAVLNKLQQYTATQGITTVTLTDGATITANLNLTNKFKVTLGGNRTITATNLQDATYTFRIYQDSTGSRTLTFDTMFKFAGGTAPTLSTDPNSLDLLSCECDGTNLICVLTKDFS